MDGQRIFELEESLKLKEEELSSLTTKHLELGENYSRVSSELADVHQETEDEFKRTIATSADVVTWVLQLEQHAELSGLTPDCRSLLEVTEFLRKTMASIRSTKNRIALRLRTDQNGASLETASRAPSCPTSWLTSLPRPRSKL